MRAGLDANIQPLNFTSESLSELSFIFINASDSGLNMGFEKTHLSTKISNTPNLYVVPTSTSKVCILAVILSRP